FLFNATAHSSIYTLSLHDALPISVIDCGSRAARRRGTIGPLASVQFQSLVRQQLDPANVEELAHMSAERREAYLNQGVLRQFVRSEEHTSELQSLRHLVCRLLLEK